MYNWSTDIKKISRDKKNFNIWKLEQTINFGLGGKKLKKSELKKYWPFIKIDSRRRKFLSLLLDEK